MGIGVGKQDPRISPSCLISFVFPCCCCDFSRFLGLLLLEPVSLWPPERGADPPHSCALVPCLWRDCCIPHTQEPDAVSENWATPSGSAVATRISVNIALFVLISSFGEKEELQSENTSK